MGAQRRMGGLLMLYDIIVQVMSNCGLDYVFVADTGLSLIDCTIASLDWATDSHVVVTCEVSS